MITNNRDYYFEKEKHRLTSELEEKEKARHQIEIIHDEYEDYHMFSTFSQRSREEAMEGSRYSIFLENKVEQLYLDRENACDHSEDLIAVLKREEYFLEDRIEQIVRDVKKETEQT